MKASLIVAAAFAASVNGAVIEQRQRPRSSTRVPAPSVPDGIAPPAPTPPPQIPPPQFSIGRPTQSFTFFPNDPADRVEKCGLDAFVGHTAEALLFCSSILKGGTATQTITTTNLETITTKSTVITTLYPPSAAPSSSVRPPPVTTIRSTSTRVPPPPSSSAKPSSTVVIPPSSTVQSPLPTASTGCGIVGYTGAVAAYYFDSSGTKNTWTACKAACTADTKCVSFGYGEANCLLFNVPAAGNVNYNPMSPYTFYDASCPKELPVRKRQVNISLQLPGGPPAISSACSCLITSGTPDTVTTTTVTTSLKTTTTQVVTRTVSLLPGDGDKIV